MNFSPANINNLEILVDNETLTVDGARQVTIDTSQYKEYYFTIRILGPVTGVTPTIQFTLFDQDLFQVSVTGNSTNSNIYTAPTLSESFKHDTQTGLMQINWFITGAGASFGGVYVGITGIKDAFITGQATMANSTPVVIASDQSPIAVTGTITTSPNVNIHDAAGNNLTSQVNGAQRALDVGIDVAGVQIDPRSIRALASGTDSITSIQGTSPWVISGTVIANEDKNYGVVGANTLRSAAQIGNATGAALFGAGTTTAQVLRVVLPTDQTSIPVTQSTSPWVISGTVTSNQGTSPWVVSGTVTANQGTSPWVISGTVIANEDKNYGTVGANTLRTASQIGNATGAALFGAGTTTAQVLRVVLPTDQTAIPVTQSTSPWVISGTVTANAGTGTFTTQDTSSLVDNNPFTDGTSRVLPAGYVFDDVAGTALTENDIAAARVDSKRAQVFVIEDATTRGQKAAVSAAGALSENLVQVGGSNLTLGQKTSANSIPVVISSDQSTIATTAIPASSTTNTYSAISTGLATGLLATDIFTITGSATKIVKIKKIRVTATRSGSTNTDIFLIKRSTANSGGTSTAETMVSHDSSDGAATAVVRSYTLNPTLGTTVGTVRIQKQFINVAGTGPTDIINWDFGQDTSKPIVLNSASQVLAINLGGQTITTPSFDIFIEWIEG